MSNAVKLPLRSEVNEADTWDLSSLFTDEEAWNVAYKELGEALGKYESFQGTLGESAENLAACLKFDYELERLAERLGVYAFLMTAGDQSDDDAQARFARFRHLASQLGQAASFIRPEIMAIPDEKMSEFLAHPAMELYQLALDRTLRYKAHTLSSEGERLLAMQSQMAGTAGAAFRQLNDVDLNFGEVTDEEGKNVELTQATFSQFLQSPDRGVRRAAFHQFYDQYDKHKHTLAAVLNGSIQKDIYYAQARGYENALGSALFDDNVPQTVYDNLISSVRSHLPALHRYYDLRRRKMGLEDIHHYDTYVPILSDIKKHTAWDQAVDIIVESLQPLGSEYCTTLEAGLRGRWCDRYPNKNKQSGAFSYGTFDGDPYIMMNYKPDVLDDVFTLTHEAGHSMHSHYSSSNQPFEYYSYVIFVAEVASTFNEQLLARHLKANAESDRERAFIINKEIDDIRSTIIRQTMFAEFEKITHAMAEAGEPLTLKSFTDAYGKLLTDYFGPEFTIDEMLPLECFRIPHFYRAFYVYQYATGMSAAIALSEKVLGGGEAELTAYLNFLKGGGSKFPLDLLRDAGVDLESPEPVDTALTNFEKLVEELDSLLD